MKSTRVPLVDNLSLPNAALLVRAVIVKLNQERREMEAVREEQTLEGGLEGIILC